MRYRKGDDCWNAACLKRNCYQEIHDVNKDHSVLGHWTESAIYGGRDKLIKLFDDLTKGNIYVLSMFPSFSIIWGTKLGKVYTIFVNYMNHVELLIIFYMKNINFSSV